MYQALYRKWRPLTFDDVVGQRHVTDTIKNEVKNGAVGHAFLFCGSRGTGKTSTARIFSRAINCENPQNGNPCNKCPTCRGILDGSIMDITEIDAASNSGVDNIRSLREEAGYSAAITKYKVYIIDEVHALSPGAFNALLKLLEEPPEHVKFVLATTEAHKVMDTISSRCQRFDFKRITSEDIYQRLEYICNAEGIDAEERALRMIARAADGSLRDALSCLDPCVAAGKEVDTDFVADFLGQSDSGAVVELCRAIVGENTAAAVACMDGVSARGRSFPTFIETAVKALRDMLVSKSVNSPKSDFSPEESAELRDIAKGVSVEKLLYSIKTLSDALWSARQSTMPAVIFEAAVIKLCIGGNDGSYDALLARVGELERKIASGEIAVAAAPAAKKAAAVEPPEPEEDEEPLEPDREIYAPQPEFVDKIKAKWPEILESIMSDVKFVLYSAIENCTLREFEGKLALTFPDEGFAEFRIMVLDDIDYLKGLIKRLCGMDIGVTIKCDADFARLPQMKRDDPMDALLGLPITEIQ
ncbi:MAG: DNA polymerase III subunit gamma/tau [Oscillospiraceae bacterium]|nr:DNA polymerase III subunit gamma/tau [Oscillospiraceae bacterium]